MTYATILKIHRWIVRGGRESKIPKVLTLDGKISLPVPAQWQIWAALSEKDYHDKYQRVAAYKYAAFCIRSFTSLRIIREATTSGGLKIKTSWINFKVSVENYI